MACPYAQKKRAAKAKAKKLARNAQKAEDRMYKVCDNSNPSKRCRVAQARYDVAKYRAKRAKQKYEDM